MLFVSNIRYKIVQKASETSCFQNKKENRLKTNTFLLSQTQIKSV